MNTGPRYARRTDENHSELRGVIKDCAKAFPKLEIAYVDTSNLGGKVGDFIIQFRNMWRGYCLETFLLEIKKDAKAKLTKSQEDSPLELVRIECRADVFDLLGQIDWELT